MGSDNLGSQKDDDYQKEHKEMMKYYMAFPEGISMHEYIAITIDEIIKKTMPLLTENASKQSYSVIELNV